MRLAPHLIAVSLAIPAALGCSSSTTDTTTIVRPELVQVSPSDFLGVQTCGKDAGDVQSYVATLFDITPSASGVVPNPGIQLPSSPAAPCALPVTFSYVLVDHVYLAQVDGYDRAATDLVATAPGARIQLDSAGDRVSPRWTTKCGGYHESGVIDGGSYITVGGAPSAPSATDAGADAGAAGAGAGAGGSGGLSGVVSYDQITQSPHDCGDGLQ